MTNSTTYDILYEVLTKNITDTSIKPYVVSSILDLITKRIDVNMYYDNLLTLISNIGIDNAVTTANNTNIINMVLMNNRYVTTMKALNEFINDTNNISVMRDYVDSIRSIINDIVNEYLILNHINGSNVSIYNVSNICNLVDHLKCLYRYTSNVHDSLHILLTNDDVRYKLNDINLESFIKTHNNKIYDHTNISNEPLSTTINNLKDLLDIMLTKRIDNTRMNVSLEYSYDVIYITLTYNHGNDMVTIPVHYCNVMSSLLRSLIDISNEGPYNDLLTTHIEILYQKHILTIIDELSTVISLIDS